MRKLIINADDLGISSVVDAQIEECILRGVVTSSTLMANAPAFDDGVRIAKENPQISIGVHLNLIEFQPLTNSDVFRRHGIIDEEGRFIEGAIFAYPIDNELKRAVFEEWDAQISRVEAAGLVPSHCDSHQHAHTINALQEPLIRVLEKHHIKKVRRRMVPSIRLMLREKKHPTIHLDKSNSIQAKKHSILYRRLHLLTVIRDSKRWNRKMSQHFKMTDSFYAFRFFYSDGDVLRLGGPYDTIELMCHPGHPAFQTETNNLMRDRNWLKEGFTLATYREV